MSSREGRGRPRSGTETSSAAALPGVRQRHQVTRIGLAVSICVGLLAGTSPAHAVPLQMPVQGLLHDNAGQPAPSGAYEVVFVLYAQAEGGAAVWSEAWPPADTTCEEEPAKCVGVELGVFDIMLGSHQALDAGVFAAYGDLWLGVAVVPEAEMVPRRPLASVPYAVHAASAAVTTGLACSGCVSAEALGEDAWALIHEEAVAAGEQAGFVTAATPVFEWALADGPGGQALSAKTTETLAGVAANATGGPLPGTIPVTDDSGKIPEQLLPFEHGAVVARGTAAS